MHHIFKKSLKLYILYNIIKLSLTKEVKNVKIGKGT